MKPFHKIQSQLLLLLLLLGSAPAALPGGAAAAQDLPAGGPVVTRAPDGLRVEWQAPAAQVRLLPGGFARPEVPGYPQLQRPGEPELPYSTALVALPAGVQPELEILEIREQEVDLPAPLALAPQPQGVERGSLGEVIGGAYSAPGGFSGGSGPAAPVVFEAAGVLRGVSLGRLVFYPARLQGGRLRLVERIVVAVRFNRPEGAPEGAATGGRALPEPFLSSLEGALANPWDLPLAVSPAPDVSLVPAVPQGEAAPARPEASPAAVIEVVQPGLTAVTYADLASAGFPVAAADAGRLQLERAGVEIPFELDGDGDNLFEPGERLVFYAQPRFSRYSRFDAYQLVQAAGSRLPMETRSAAPGSLTAGTAWIETTFEENLLYTPDCYCAPLPPGRDGDRWAWKEISRPAAPSAAFTFDLADADVAQPGHLDVWLTGFTDLPASPDHRVQASLNGSVLGQVDWNGKKAEQLSVEIPAGLLKSTGNSLSVLLPGGLAGVDVEGAWVDAFRVRYARSSAAAGSAVQFRGESARRAYQVSLAGSGSLRAYDITDPDRPQRLQNLGGSGGSATLGDPASGAPRRYWVTRESGLLSPARLRLLTPLPGDETFDGTDYLVIAPGEFLPALDDLVALRRAQGLGVAVVDVQAIYDAFGDGRPEPAAIRDFLAHAYAAWSPQPTYVLLVGDGTADPKRYLDSSSATFIPPFLEDVDPWAGETAADNRFVTLDGNDTLPDMLIGRLPVNSMAEAQAVVGKLLRYEAAPPPGRWKSTALFVADDADQSGPFPALSEKLVQEYILPHLLPGRLYYGVSGLSVEEMRQQLQSAWNAGTGLLFYTGHSSIHQWAVEIFLHLDWVTNLQNGSRLPILAEMTCFTGAFQVPGFRTLDEMLLVHSGGGAAAVWGATGLGVSTGHSYLAQGFLNSLIKTGQVRLGKAALAGKLELAKAGVHLDLLDTYTLLGDPATAVQLEPADFQFLPAVLAR